MNHLLTHPYPAPQEGVLLLVMKYQFRALAYATTFICYEGRWHPDTDNGFELSMFPSAPEYTYWLLIQDPCLPAS